MIHIPRPTIPGAVLVLGLAAALVAPGATGRSQAAPVNTKEPFIASPYLVQVGTHITGNKGNWDGKEPITYSYQWLRCDKDALNCQKITNATGTDYEIVKADAGHTLRFEVTAKNADGSTKALSNGTQEIPGSANEPVASSPPTISGTPVVGEKLTAARGTWQGTQPITYTYRWQTCNAADTTCHNTGSQGTVYTVGNADVGLHVRVRVTAKNSAGESNAFSLPTAAVKSSGGGGGGTGTAVPVSDVGPAGERLVVDQVTFTPNPVSSRSQPITVRIRIKDTKGRLVSGALVKIQSTPVVASIPTPQPTGEDGGVTYSIQPEGDFPLKNGYSVQFFVKAYRQGDPTLAGISGTRLVQVKTKAP
jgi:hypothetical protein